MNRIALAGISATLACTVIAGTAFAQTAASAPNEPTAPMVKPPPASATNPDNMPVKKPRKPTNDNMLHTPPASASNAK